ncbi:phosphatidylglycerophosphatase [Campylobacter mucosalis]|uniref:phosphatidylglycerophosphatase A family protein n=1 Tax=Campylobacter mucosalis TaxID=202 RepID=UPI0004D84000|nr:phosphatidylglycerophosphatase A [Campylobacter mucosalis]KEA46294.1 phosphatidylglycerophosphatase [Campylobacter mucosalis]QKF62766.1 phosphatidylglycerophosphatase A [Campylobacter mucosalis]
MQRVFLTFFGAGLSPKAPGTAGSIAATIVAFFVLKFFSATTLFLATILISLVAINVINEYEKKTGEHDHQSIVIDEVAGVWLAFVISGTTITQMILSLIFFRIFDITKPSIIGRIDRNVKGGLGVMGDDLVAGFVAGIASAMVYGVLLKFGISVI